MSMISNQILVQEYEYDFAVDGGATGVITLSAKDNKSVMPTGAVRKATHVLVQTALVGASASAKVGTTASDADFAADAGVATYSLNAIFNDTTPVVVSATSDDCLLTISGGALTAGKLKIFVEYIVPTT